MDENAKRFARRILALHGLLLLLVLATVGLAAREIYRSTHDQMVQQTERRQELLASETASGIESHYQSILNDLDLMRQAETDETGATTEPVRSDTARIVPTPDLPRPDRTIPGRTNPNPGPGSNPGPGQPRRPGGRIQIIAPNTPGAVGALNGAFNRSNLVYDMMWRQVGGRVQLLYVRNHLNPSNPDDLRVVHNDDPQHLVPAEINDRTHDWIDGLTEPSLSRFDSYNGVGVNLICIPLARGHDALGRLLSRDLVAVVPIGGIEKEFLQPLNEGSTGAWLIDEAGTAMAASRPELVGTTVTNIPDPELHDLADQYIQKHEAGTQVMPHNFKIGTANFVPAIITAQPVKIGNIEWELFVTTSLDDVDDVVGKLLHKALLWCLFVVFSVTAILVSTSIQMIRTRGRVERVRHEVLTRELSQAREIQLAWLPDHQPINGAIDIAAINSPASHISGDFYNWFELPDGRIVVTVGDVTGHGMAAAFLMATTQLLVRNTMMRLVDPGKCLEEVNRQLCVQVFNGQFVTMLVLILDMANGKMQVATAGHPAPLLADGESFQPLPIEPQLVLGVDRESQYVTEHFDLSPQASILLYTDGVVECPDLRFARFGDERLRRSIYGRYENAKLMLNQVMTAINTFRGTRELADDLTMVAIQLQPIGTSTTNVAEATRA